MCWGRRSMVMADHMWSLVSIHFCLLDLLPFLSLSLVTGNIFSDIFRTTANKKQSAILLVFCINFNIKNKKIRYDYWVIHHIAHIKDTNSQLLSMLCDNYIYFCFSKILKCCKCTHDVVKQVLRKYA